MQKKKFLDIISNFRKQTILVLGDLMLDEWIWGKVNRISPEAPVPVVQVEKRTFTPGGASNVAANLRTLGARTIVAGLIGTDEPGKTLKRKLRECGADLRGILPVKGRPTTLKTRIIAHSQQVVRADFESREKLNDHVVERMEQLIAPAIKEADALLFSDYNKGCISSIAVSKLIEAGKARKRIVAAGPKPVNLSLFAGATLIVLNQGEAEQGAGFEIRNMSDLEKAGAKLLSRLKVQALFITRGENGMAVLESGKKLVFIPAHASQVYDVSGAGDTVVAVATLAVASGAGFYEAAVLSNLAASVVVKKIGTATVTAKELEETL